MSPRAAPNTRNRYAERFELELACRDTQARRAGTNAISSVQVEAAAKLARANCAGKRITAVNALEDTSVSQLISCLSLSISRSRQVLACATNLI